MSYSDTLSKVESAFKTVIESLAITGLRVYRGNDGEERLSPFAIAMADSAAQEIRDTGLWRVVVSILVASSADDFTLDAHRGLVGQVFDKLMEDDIAATLSASTVDFHVYDCESTGLVNDQQDRLWVDQGQFDVVCCPSDIS